MAYTPTTWVDGQTKLGPTNLNKMEKGIAGAAQQLKYFGAVGDGISDDTVAIQNAEAANDLIFSPAGTFKTSLAATQLTGRFRGVGQVESIDGNKRAPWFSAVSSAPSSLGAWGSVDTAFNGDLSKTQITMEHRVTGTATLGEPATGYQDNHEAAPINLYLYNSSGWNQDTADNNGRTSIASIYSRVFHAGQGDAICYSGTAFVDGAKPGATSFLANPAATLFNGEVDAGAAGVFLNPVEIHLNDEGFDVAGIGAVFDLNRTVNTGALNAFWGGVRVQSSGTKPVDTAFMGVQVTSGFQVGLDLSNAGLQSSGTWNQAAITLSQDQRIYFQASGTDGASSIYRLPSSTGSTYVTYNSGLSSMQFVVGNTGVLLLANSQVTTSVNFAIGDGFALIAGSTTGLKIGTATTQKLGFYNVTPVVQPNGTGNTHTVTAGSTTSVFTNTTFDGSTGSTAYTVGDIVKALKGLGLLAA